jgi:hypothetical protein
MFQWNETLSEGHALIEEKFDSGPQYWNCLLYPKRSKYKVQL